MSLPWTHAFPTSHPHDSDIRQLDLDKLRRRGIVGVVLDKDNCLVSQTPVSARSFSVTRDAPADLVSGFRYPLQTKPRRDAVVEELKVSRASKGRSRVLWFLSAVSLTSLVYPTSFTGSMAAAGESVRA